MGFHACRGSFGRRNSYGASQMRGRSWMAPFSAGRPEVRIFCSLLVFVLKCECCVSLFVWVLFLVFGFIIVVYSYVCVVDISVSCE